MSLLLLSEVQMSVSLILSSKSLPSRLSNDRGAGDDDANANAHTHTHAHGRDDDDSVGGGSCDKPHPVLGIRVT